MKKENKQQEKEYITMDMPEVKDIPGQENVHPPRMREMEDNTPSSADEEGEGILDELNTDQKDLVFDDSSNVSPVERKALAQAGRPDNDEREDLRRIPLDSRDDDEEKLNEEADPIDFGADLDVPGTDMDDGSEDIGAEDEENNPYTVNKQ